MVVIKIVDFFIFRQRKLLHEWMNDLTHFDVKDRCTVLDPFGSWYDTVFFFHISLAVFFCLKLILHNWLYRLWANPRIKLFSAFLSFFNLVIHSVNITFIVFVEFGHHTISYFTLCYRSSDHFLIYIHYEYKK